MTYLKQVLRPIPQIGPKPLKKWSEYVICIQLVFLINIIQFVLIKQIIIKVKPIFSNNMFHGR